MAAPVEDPGVAAWLLAPYTPREEGSLRALQGRLAPDCKPRVPNLLRAGVTATCRAALLTLAVTEPAVHLLRSQGMLEVGGWVGGCSCCSSRCTSLATICMGCRGVQFYHSLLILTTKNLGP